MMPLVCSLEYFTSAVAGSLTVAASRQRTADTCHRECGALTRRRYKGLKSVFIGVHPWFSPE